MTTLMDATLQTKVWTDDELLALPHNGHKYEVLKGVLSTVPVGIEHEFIGVRLISALAAFAETQKLGIVVGSRAGFWMANRDFLSPDVSFIAKERLKDHKRAPKKFFAGAPDLAVEILSPRDTVNGLHEKLVDYFASGSRLVWVINPEQHVVLVYHSPQRNQVLGEGEVISGEQMVPGFTMPVSELFAPLEF